MARLEEPLITEAIIKAYHEKLLNVVRSDVIIVGAGPSGLMAAHRLGRDGYKVVVLEKKLATGGGIWGGGMAMNEAVVQDDALHLLDEANVRHKECGNGLHTFDTVELSACLTVLALRSGATILNLTFAEDVSIRDGRVCGIVANRTNIGGVMHVDPIMLACKAVIDGTGHDSVVVEAVRKRGLLLDSPVGKSLGEGAMDAEGGERFVVENVSEVYPGLWVMGMSVSAALGGPRMGPIFGGMLLSGERVANQVSESLGG